MHFTSSKTDRIRPTMGSGAENVSEPMAVRVVTSTAGIVRTHIEIVR